MNDDKNRNWKSEYGRIARVLICKSDALPERLEERIDTLRCENEELTTSLESTRAQARGAAQYLREVVEKPSCDVCARKAMEGMEGVDACGAQDCRGDGHGPFANYTRFLSKAPLKAPPKAPQLDVTYVSRVEWNKSCKQDMDTIVAIFSRLDKLEGKKSAVPHWFSEEEVAALGSVQAGYAPRTPGYYFRMHDDEWYFVDAIEGTFFGPFDKLKEAKRVKILRKGTAVILQEGDSA